MIQRYTVQVGDQEHEAGYVGEWPATAALCPEDNQRLIYTVHGDLFYCANEADEHLYMVHIRPGHRED